MTLQHNDNHPFSPYPAYKDSGIEWIGEIPEHWEIKKLKWNIKVNSGGGIESEDILPLGTYSVYGGNGITGYSENYNYDGEILILGRVGAYCGSVYLISGKNWVTDNALVVTTDGNKEFLFYTLLLMDLNRFASKNAQPLITGTLVKNQFFAAPTSIEQTTIANFLDHKTNQIDTAIDKHRQLIELLREHRAAIINEAVTKGLNPDAPMKDSGVEWIGEVPAHWEVTKVGYLLSFIGYGFTNPMPTKREGVFMLTANDVRDGFIDFENARKTSIKAYEQNLTDKSRPELNDVLLTKDGTLGRVAICNKVPVCINQSVAVLRAKKSQIVPEFLSFLLRSHTYNDRMIFDAGGTTIKHIYITRLSKMEICISPKLDEQKKIVNFIQSETTRIDREITLAQQEIDLLQEYRQSLIAEAVTGKIDVRDYVLED
ncbi:MAG: restriction endonuclease subunit S [bacterium]|nr:restriction endonuclease subunit S [bacterium]